jgi:hypothetical protein
MADSGNIWAATIPADGAAVYAAPLGTTLPTSATASLDGAFTDLGWVSEDGVTNSISREVTKHRAWGGEVVKVTQDNYTETVRLTLLESSSEVLKVVYGKDNVTAGPNYQSLKVEHSRLQLERQSFVIDFIDGDRAGRIVVREGQVTEVGDVVYVHRDLTRYEITIDVFKPDNADNAVVAYFDYALGS